MPYFNGNDYYLCKAGKYTINCVVQIRRIGSDGSCHVTIIEMLPSEERYPNSGIGQTWDAQLIWLTPVNKNFRLNPNVSFLYRKKGKLR
jgi:hypothetical protein